MNISVEEAAERLDAVLRIVDDWIDSMTDEMFLFDDFFVPNDDPGVQVDVAINGRSVPIMVKRGLSLGDREAAKAIATKTRLDLTKGQLVVESFDDGAFTLELLFRCIKSWPFVRDGKQVPVTRENILALKSSAADAFALLVQNLVQDKSEALTPFVKASDAAS